MNRVDEFFDILNSEHSIISSRIYGKLLLVSGHGGTVPSYREMSIKTGLDVDVIESILAGLDENDTDYTILEKYVDEVLEQAERSAEEESKKIILSSFKNISCLIKNSVDNDSLKKETVLSSSSTINTVAF